MYRPAETSPFARDDVVGRRRGAASGVRVGRRYYTRSAASAGRNRGDDARPRRASEFRPPIITQAHNQQAKGSLSGC